MNSSRKNNMNVSDALRLLNQMDEQEDEFDIGSDLSDDPYQGFAGEDTFDGIEEAGNFDNDIVVDSIVNNTSLNGNLNGSLQTLNETQSNLPELSNMRTYEDFNDEMHQINADPTIQPESSESHLMTLMMTDENDARLFNLISEHDESMDEFVVNELDIISRQRHLSGLGGADHVERNQDVDCSMRQLEYDIVTADANDDIPLAELHPACRVPVTRPIRSRRYPPYLQIYDIESAFNSNSYDVVLCEEFPEIVTIEDSEGNVTEKWTTERQPSVGRTDISDCREGMHGVYPQYRQFKTPLDVWQLFITDSMLKEIVNCTNKAINKTWQQYGMSKTCSISCATDVIELKAYFGLMYLRGSINMNGKAAKFLYQSKNYLFSSVFRAIMSLNRFRFLSAHIAFDDYSTRQSRWKYDKFAALRSLFESFITNCAKIYAPDTYLSLDESLYPTHVGVSFRVYMKNKPHRYGMLYRSINSAVVPYTYTAIVAAGKPQEESHQYYISGTCQYVQTLVKNLERGLLGTGGNLHGCNISMDRFYNSMPLVRWLLRKNITMIGTVDHRRKGISKLGSLQGREDWSTKFYKNVTTPKTNAMSYVANTKSGKKI